VKQVLSRLGQDIDPRERACAPALGFLRQANSPGQSMREPRDSSARMYMNAREKPRRVLQGMSGGVNGPLPSK
jgi:hypothetical protein